MDEPATIIERRRLPWGLRRAAQKRGVTELELLTDVITRNATFDEAAREFGCSVETLRKYRRILRIEVRGQEGGQSCQS